MMAGRTKETGCKMRTKHNERVTVRERENLLVLCCLMRNIIGIY